MKIWIVIVAVSLVTFALRASFVLVADPHRFPQAFRRALAYVPPAVLAAIIAPGLLMPIDIARCIAGLVAFVVAARLRHPLAAIAVGMPVLWLAQWAIR